MLDQMEGLPGLGNAVFLYRHFTQSMDLILKRVLTSDFHTGLEQ